MITSTRLPICSLSIALLWLPPAALAAERAQRKDPHPAAARALRPLIEKHLEIVHLLTAGLLAHQFDDWAAAAAAFDALLARKDLPADVAAAVRPIDAEVRARLGRAPLDLGTPVLDPPLDTPQVARPLDQPQGVPAEEVPGEKPGEKPKEQARPPPREFAVSGTITGGGPGGPGGAVIMLRRADGKTPKPTPWTSKLFAQKDKKFLPHVLAVPVGSRVVFKNQDRIFHNVFSIGPVKSFDSGLKRPGDSENVVFDRPGPVELLCNIPASMNGWLYVVDTPWYAVADGAGAFRLESVPTGDYEVEVWHEWAREHLLAKATVSEGGEKLSFTIGGDRRANPFPSDKYGKPRQPQLGY